jgi:hypothetical protein
MKSLITVSILALSLAACFDPAASNSVSDEESLKKQRSGEIPTLKSGDTPDSLIIYDAQQNIILQKSVKSDNQLSGDYPELQTESYPLQVVLFDEDEKSTYMIQEEATQSNSVTIPDQFEDQLDCTPNGCNESNDKDSTQVVEPIEEGCIEIYAPVCSEGVTYGNSCKAQTAGVQRFEDGECKDSILQVDSINQICTTVYEPVCAEGKNYSNACFAMQASKNNYVEGVCEGDQGVCPTIHIEKLLCFVGTAEPVYENGCLKEYQCPNGQDVLTDTIGNSCPEIYSPVCAEGVTYSNTCEAQTAGVQRFEEGVCKEDKVISIR